MSKNNVVRTKQDCQTEWMTSKKLNNRKKCVQLIEDFPIEKTN